MKQPRIFRYKVDEVWGNNPPVMVGTIILDRWKGDRTWNIYTLSDMTPLSGFHAKLVGEVEPDMATTVIEHWLAEATQSGRPS